MSSKVSAFLALVLLAAGCSDAPCIRHSDCPTELICDQGGSCIVPPDAAPTPDARIFVDAEPRPDAEPVPDAGPEADADPSLDEPDAS